MYKSYRDHRPSEELHADSPFYLQDIKNPVSGVWFNKTHVGKDKLGTMMNVLAEEGELEGRNVNHTCRKTCAATLVQAGRPATEISQLADWKNIQTVNEYAVSSIEQQADTSDIIYEVLLPNTNDNNISKPVTEQGQVSLITNESNKENCVSNRLNPWAILCCANVHGGNININIYSGKRKRVTCLSQSSHESDY